MNACIWYNQVTTEADLNTTTNDKTTRLHEDNSLELEVAQELEKDKHMVIALLMGANPSYEPICVDLAKKFTMGEDK